MTGFFVTGTDTAVGKTLVCAWLVRRWQADYWKPVQCGTEDGTDVDTVVRLSEAGSERIHPSAHVLEAPLSPHAAAALENVHIDLADFSLPRTDRPLIVEGAGGALVPLNDTHFMTDLMAHLGLPIIVVARSTLGTINHSLLTLEALRRRDLAVAGVILNGPFNAGNRNAVGTFGDCRVLAEVPLLIEETAAGLDQWPEPPPAESVI